ncbi:hypothetical protein SteCoe_14770 [Stentor coeruleus]|uniref:Uncharacterized protein n=1 Tax=Stentor coeruleus TaxID=5963 RepID=A0A1R2C561_9CILI|nr:hypothetical protein SteCoe_14770 [Stentor coeruleus]
MLKKIPEEIEYEKSSKSLISSPNSVIEIYNNSIISKLNQTLLEKDYEIIQLRDALEKERKQNQEKIKIMQDTISKFRQNYKDYRNFLLESNEKIMKTQVEVVMLENEFKGIKDIQDACNSPIKLEDDMNKNAYETQDAQLSPLKIEMTNSCTSPIVLTIKTNQVLNGNNQRKPFHPGKVLKKSPISNRTRKAGNRN